jgi:hypothetical protein
LIDQSTVLGANAALLILVLAAVALSLAAVVVWLALRMARLERHYRAVTAGTEGGNLQSVLEQHVEELRQAGAQVAALQSDVQAMKLSSRDYVQHVGFLRYNPFRETGGDQSFVLALADGDGNGAVVSSLHSRDVTRIYGKPLSGWCSPYQLTDEEQQVINRARQQP